MGLIKLLYIQYAGDYREAVFRFRKGLKENYYAQEYTVNSVQNLAKKTEETSVLCCVSEDVYDECLSEGVRTLGAGLRGGAIPTSVLKSYVQKLQPTHIVLRFPHWRFIRWALTKKIKIFPVFADSFFGKGVKRKIGSWLLAKYLNHPSIKWVANHQTNAAHSLVDIGVNPEKVIPYDFEHKYKLERYSHKKAPETTKPWNLFFCGVLCHAKGVGDLITAVSIVNDQHKKVTLKIAGKGDLENFKNQVDRLGLNDSVTFVGLIPNEDVIVNMNQSDLVLVLSHHEYPEGFPMTLMESMVARTPLIVSDHPMFLNKIVDGEAGKVVSQKSGEDIARMINWMMSHPSKYEEMSRQLLNVWHRLILPTKWADIIERWVRDSREDKIWLQQHTLFDVEKLCCAILQ